MSTIKPLNDYLLLEKLPSEKKQGNIATIMAMGPGKTDENGKLVAISGMKVGDKVIYREYAGTDYEDDGHKYLLLKAEDVLAVVND